MPDYSKGLIYRIVCNETGEQYIGSTTQTLTKRLSQHKKDISRNPCSSTQIINRGNYAIVLIEECPCENKNQLERRERYFIETIECVNMKKPAQTKEELREHKREYREINNEQILENKKIYRENNKEQIRDYRREYYKNKNK